MMRYPLSCGSCQAPMSGRGMGSPVMFEDRRPIITLRGVELSDTLLAPGTVAAAMEDVAAHASHLDNDIRTSVSAIMQSAQGQRFYNDWVTWYAQWIRWYEMHRPGFTSTAAYLTGETVATLRQRASEYNELEDRFRSATGQEPTYNPHATDSNSWLGLPVAAWVGIGAGMVALVAVAWTASSVAKIKGPRLAGRRRR